MLKNLVVEMSGDIDKFSDRLKALNNFSKKYELVNIYMFVPHQYKLKSFILPKNVEGIECSSMRKSLQQFSTLPDAVFVSAGNTGDIALSAHVTAGTIGERLTPPILANTYPKITGHAVFLDIGASLWPNENLMIWAAFAGKIMAEVLYNHAKIGLLNIGEEKDKGGELRNIREAIEKELGVIIENIEMNKIIESDINVLVTSGFLGNLTIKTFEGTIKTLYRKTFVGPLAPISKLLFKILYKICWQDMDWKKYSGAYLLGIKKPILVTHGRCDEKAFHNALERAIDPKTEEIFMKINNNAKLTDWLKNRKNESPK